MADEPDDELLLDNEVQDEEAAETDEITLEFEGDEQQEETPLIKQLRQRERDLARENAELKRSQQPKAKIEVGAKPTLESCDYDPDRYERERDAYDERKRQAETQEREQNEARQAQNRQYERAKAEYDRKAAQLGVRDYSSLERVVADSLSDQVLGIAVQYLNKPEMVVAALGQNPARLAAIARETDPMRQIMMLKEAEMTMKQRNTRAKPPEPEADTIVRGSRPVAVGSVEKERERLEREADRTGDRTKIIAFNRAQKEKK